MQVSEQHDTLPGAKQALASALRQLQVQTEEIQANEKRLASAKTEEQDLLAAEMDEAEQVSKLGKVVALQRLLDSRIEQGRNRLESSKGELHCAAQEAFKSFWEALTILRDTRQARNLDRLKVLVAPDQWPRAEALAVSFVRLAKDMTPLDLLGDHANNLLRAGAVRQAAEALLQDITALEAEKAADR
jgi:hypothetical protein